MKLLPQKVKAISELLGEQPEPKKEHLCDTCEAPEYHDCFKTPITVQCVNYVKKKEPSFSFKKESNDDKNNK